MNKCFDILICNHIPIICINRTWLRIIFLMLWFIIISFEINKIICTLSLALKIMRANTCTGLLYPPDPCILHVHRISSFFFNYLKLLLIIIKNWKHIFLRHPNIWDAIWSKITYYKYRMEEIFTWDFDLFSIIVTKSFFNVKKIILKIFKSRPNLFGLFKTTTK